MIISQHHYAANFTHVTLGLACVLGLMAGCESKTSSPASSGSADSATGSSIPAVTLQEQTDTPKPVIAQSTEALESAGAKLTRDPQKNVTSIDLRGCKLSESIVKEISSLPSLQQLDLRECELSNTQFAAMVKPLTKLRAVRLSGKGGATTVDDEGLAALAGCTDLRVLAADELWFSEDGLKKLSGCKNLTELYISATLIEDAAMPTVATFKQLKKLRLARSTISSEGLKALADLKIEELDLSECTQINDAAMHDVAKFTSLKRLNLWRDPISDEGCSKLAGLTQLTWYNLDNTQLTDAGLDHLAGMVELTFLHLGSTGVSDAGMTKLLGLTKLKDLKVTRTAVTEAGAKLLSDKIPGLNVQVKYREDSEQ